jgi:hypothetical protein
MLNRQNPFSFYDFLGYFIPGAVVLYAIFFAIIHAKSHAFGMQVVNETITLFKKDFYLPFIIASYIIGHLFSFVSSVTIEKWANWLFGYPSKYLIGVEPNGFFNPESARIRRIIGRLIVSIIILPVTFFEIILGKLMNLRELYIREASDITISVIKNSINLVFVKTLGNMVKIDEQWYEDQGFFRYCYHYALENAPNHNPKMQNYVALFGFTRTVTLIFILFFWLFVWHVIEGRFCWSSACFLLASTGFIAYIFFIAFNKFYRRYSLEVLMAASAAVYIGEEMGKN